MILFNDANCQGPSTPAAARRWTFPSSLITKSAPSKSPGPSEYKDAMIASCEYGVSFGV
ncbi:hypothetical protein BJX96DRAFT_179303 [Aspergillus floccosus]